jgi:hypothetical protein
LIQRRRQRGSSGYQDEEIGSRFVKRGSIPLLSVYKLKTCSAMSLMAGCFQLICSRDIRVDGCVGPMAMMVGDLHELAAANNWDIAALALYRVDKVGNGRKLANFSRNLYAASNDVQTIIKRAHGYLQHHVPQNTLAVGVGLKLFAVFAYESKQRQRYFGPYSSCCAVVRSAAMHRKLFDGHILAAIFALEHPRLVVERVYQFGGRSRS